MTISPESRSVMRLFNAMKNLQIINTSENFDIFYVFMKQVEEYADKYKS